MLPRTMCKMGRGSCAPDHTSCCRSSTCFYPRRGRRIEADRPRPRIRSREEFRRPEEAHAAGQPPVPGSGAIRFLPRAAHCGQCDTPCSRWENGPYCSRQVAKRVKAFWLRWWLVTLSLLLSGFTTTIRCRNSTGGMGGADQVRYPPVALFGNLIPVGLECGDRMRGQTGLAPIPIKG